MCLDNRSFKRHSSAASCFENTLGSMAFASVNFSFFNVFGLFVFNHPLTAKFIFTWLYSFESLSELEVTVQLSKEGTGVLWALCEEAVLNYLWSNT